MFLLPRSAGRPDDRHVDTIELGHVSVTRITHVDHYALTPTEFFPETDRPLWEAHRSWLTPEHWDVSSDGVRVVVQSWVLRSAGRTVVIDTGLTPTPTRPGVPQGGRFPEALAAAGIDPSDVDLVVCTHLHPDHVGWNTRTDPGGERVPTFPRARYLFSRPDLEYFGARGDGPGRSADVFAESVAPVLRCGQAVVWDGAYRIDENLRLDLAPGHTPGLGVLTLESGADRAIFVGDLLHSPLQVVEPEVSSCFCHDPAQSARTRRRVLERAADHRALVVPAHFGGAGAVEVRRDGSRFAIHSWAGFSSRTAGCAPAGGVPPT
jgi:glyoxylase-like metal-dependent hydrolase (beta-lactamase superfamily II)